MRDYKRNNTIKLRNFHEQVDFHDMVKTLLVRMLRRKHSDNDNCQIYTEYSEGEANENYPDIQMYLKRNGRFRMPEIYTFEIQKQVNDNWTKEIVKKHETNNLIIVPIKELEKKYNIFLRELKKELEKYVV